MSDPKKTPGDADAETKTESETESPRTARPGGGPSDPKGKTTGGRKEKVELGRPLAAQPDDDPPDPPPKGGRKDEVEVP